MALRASYYGVKRNLKDELAKLDGIIPGAASGSNPLATENEIKGICEAISYTGAKNILDVILSEVKSLNTSGTWTGDVYERLGITFTCNSDGSIVVDASNSTATTDFTFSLKKYAKNTSGAPFVNNNVILSGCPAGGSNTTYYLRFRYYDDTHTAEDDGAGVTFKPTTTTTNDQVIGITVGKDFRGIATFRPMIRMAGDVDATYAAYAMTNSQLTASASDQKTTINAIITAATGAADFAAFKAAMEAITPVTRSAPASDTRSIPEEDPEEEPVTKKRTTRKTIKEGE